MNIDTEYCMNGIRILLAFHWIWNSVHEYVADLLHLVNYSTLILAVINSAFCKQRILAKVSGKVAVTRSLFIMH